VILLKKKQLSIIVDSTVACPLMPTHLNYILVMW